MSSPDEELSNLYAETGIDLAPSYRLPPLIIATMIHTGSHIPQVKSVRIRCKA